MSVARIAALIVFVAAAFLAFGWFVGQNVAHALGLVAIGLALEVLSGVPVITGPK